VIKQAALRPVKLYPPAKPPLLACRAMIPAPHAPKCNAAAQKNASNQVEAFRFAADDSPVADGISA